MNTRLFLGLALAAASLLAGEPKIENIDDSSLKKWAAELGADDFETRQKAQENLRRAGPRAQAALEAARKGGDLEVASRAEQLLAPMYTRIHREREMAWFSENFGSLFGSDLKPAAENAVARADEKAHETPDSGLSWLAKAQETDGHWDSVKHGAAKNADIEQTAFALLAFLGAGHTEKVGEHKANVKAAQQWLAVHVGEDGGVRVSKDADVDGLTQAIVGMALAEAAGMANVPATKELAQKVVNHATEKHQSRDGEKLSGFGRTPNSKKPDLLTSMLFVMQLKSAKVAGLKVDPKAFDGAIEFLDTLDQKEKGFAMAAGEKPSARATVAGLLCRQFLGWKREDLEGQANHFAKLYGTPAEPGSDDFFDWIGELVMFQQGGELWKTFNDGARLRIKAAQQHTGKLSGSIDPRGEWTNAGRVFSTAVGTLCLEIYYRYRMLR
jgi:hypothetical protein